MTIPNTTYRVFVEKLGDVNPSTFVGNEGEVFYDPDAGSPTLRLSDGSTAGGIAIGGGGGGSIAGIDTTGTSTFNNLVVTGVSTLGNTVVGGATTELIVNGDARITGILTIGTSSITLNGSTNEIRIGTAATISESGSATFNDLNVTGVGTFSGFRVNTIEGTGEAGVTRLLLQASNNGDAYLRIPTNSVSSTENVIIGNELRGVQLVGGVVLESDLLSPQLNGGTNVSPTNIPLTLGYAVLNEDVGKYWFNLNNGQEGQLFHISVGSATTASNISVVVNSARYTETVEGSVGVTTGPIVWNPFVSGTIPVSMVTLLFAQGTWNIGGGGTVTPD